MGMRPYVVRSGDHIHRLALQHGFDADAVWDHPENASLKGLRGDGTILAPGDVLLIPEPPERKWFRLEAGTVNHFVASVPTVNVTIRVAVRAKAYSDKEFTVRCGGVETQGHTDVDGTVTFEAPMDAETATIAFEPPGPTIVARIGELDPIDTHTGVLQRLRHLGHLPHGGLGQDASRGIRRFQTAADLPVTGEMDDVTCEALRAAHGC